MSQGEELIMSILLKSKIPFEREKNFSDLKGGKFRYDFYLPNHNIIIEFNGEQHYHQVKHFHKTRNEFSKAQEHDRRKISYALANGITMYCIPYWEMPKLSTIFSILNPDYEAKDRWKNDKDWKNYINNEAK